MYYNMIKIVRKYWTGKRLYMEKKIYRVPNISCGHCAHTIKMELVDLEGVKSVEVDVQDREVIVEFVAPATPEKIEALLMEINYPVNND